MKARFLILMGILFLLNFAGDCGGESETGYEVKVKCPGSGKVLYGWASTREEIPAIKRSLLETCYLWE